MARRSRPGTPGWPVLGSGPATRAVAVAALPCMTVPAGSDTDVTALIGSGALGVTWSTAGRLDVTLERPPDWGPSEVRLVESEPNAAGPMLIDNDTRPGAFTLQGGTAQAAGVYLRGPVARARARADHDVRLCAAWPMPLALAPGSLPIEMPIAPRFEAYFGSGWPTWRCNPGWATSAGCPVHGRRC